MGFFCAIKRRFHKKEEPKEEPFVYWEDQPMGLTKKYLPRLAGAILHVEGWTFPPTWPTKHGLYLVLHTTDRLTLDHSPFYAYWQEDSKYSKMYGDGKNCFRKPNGGLTDVFAWKPLKNE